MLPLLSLANSWKASLILTLSEDIHLLHGSQGCTSFALALLVRHFNEAIPLQTTAMNEAAIIVGGADRIEEAILSLKARTRPRLIGICTT
ncbi:nitrogenase component 1, partial [Rhizobium ruizarguesonis]